MNNPLLTVVIPVYNTSMYLCRCVDSVLNQTINNLRIIIVNDGSTDNSEEIIKKKYMKHPNLEYIKLNKNIGVGNARNIGIEKTNTEYITFIDSDDWVDIAYYEKMLKLMQYNQSDICITGIKTEVDDIYSWKFRYQYPSDFNVNSDFCIKSLTHQYNTDISISPIVNNKIYKTASIRDNNLYFDKTKRAQDLFFSFMVFVYAKKVSICHDVFYHYYQRHHSATHNFSIQYIDDYFYVLLFLMDELKARNLFSFYMNEYESYVYSYMTKLVNNMFNNVQKVSEQKMYIIYIMKKSAQLIPIDRLVEYIDITRLKSFWNA